MKKSFAAPLVASVLLVPALSTTAFAGDEYPGTVRTNVSVSAPGTVEKGESFEVTGKVKVPSGPAGPCRGTLTITVDKAKGKGFRSASADVPPRTLSASWTLTKKGVWNVTVSFSPNDSSPCRGSSRSTAIEVV